MRDFSARAVLNPADRLSDRPGPSACSEPREAGVGKPHARLTRMIIWPFFWTGDSYQFHRAKNRGLLIRPLDREFDGCQPRCPFHPELDQFGFTQADDPLTVYRD